MHCIAPDEPGGHAGPPVGANPVPRIFKNLERTGSQPCMSQNEGAVDGGGHLIDPAWYCAGNGKYEAQQRSMPLFLVAVLCKPERLDGVAHRIEHKDG